MWFHIFLFKGNKTLIDYIMRSNRSYSQSTCFDLCFNLEYIEKSDCNCSAVEMHHIIEKCFALVKLGSALWNCTLEFRKQFSRNIFNQKCYNYCPLECATQSYQVMINSLDLPSTGNITARDEEEWFDKEFKHFEDAQKSFFSVVVYYDELKYTYISESPDVHFVDLISNIGGILGIFLGISFLSIIEVIEILLKLVITK